MRLIFIKLQADSSELHGLLKRMIINYYLRKSYRSLPQLAICSALPSLYAAVAYKFVS